MTTQMLIESILITKIQRHKSFGDELAHNQQSINLDL